MFNYVGLFPVLSNLIFLAPAIRAYLWGRIFRTFHSTLVLFSSGSYHVCKAYPGACLFDYLMHKDFDYIVAILFLPLDALYFVHFDQKNSYLEWWAVFLSIVTVGLVTVGFTDGFVAHAILAGIVAGGVILYWIVFYVKHGKFPKYDWLQLTLAIALSLFGVALFVLQDDNPDGYWYIHTMWHITVGLGRFFLIGIKPAVPLWMNMASRISYHMSGGWLKFKDLKEEQEKDELEKGHFGDDLGRGFLDVRDRVVKGFKPDAQRETVD